jgi:hypothetical protein
MQPFVVATNADGGVEEFAEAGCGEELLARPVGDDAALTHENDSLDFRQDVAKVVSDEDEAGAFASEAAQGFAQIALCGEVKRVGRLIEKELTGAVNKRARDEDAAFFAGRHFADELVGEVGGLDAFEGFGGAVAHLRGDVQNGPER